MITEFLGWFLSFFYYVIYPTLVFLGAMGWLIAILDEPTGSGSG